MRRSISLAVIAFALLSLPVAAQVTGTVIDVDGKPIAGAQVRAYALESSAESAARLRSDIPERVALAKASTDDDGRFALKVENQDVVDILFLADGYTPDEVSVRPVGEIGAYRLRSAKMLEGTVSYKGEPFAGAVVCWTQGRIEYLTLTDEEGHYRVPDPVVWKPALAIHHPSLPPYQWTPEPFPAPYRRPDLDVSVSGRTATGVVMMNDEPVPDTTIYVDGLALGRTDDAGRFELEVSPGWREIIAIRGDRMGTVKRGAKELVVRLAPGARIAGRVLDERGRGIQQAQVSLVSAVRRYRGSRGHRMITLLTGADGSFSSEPVAPGRYEVSVLRPGYSPATSEIVGASGEVASEDVVLAPSSTITGSVADEERTPAAGVLVGVENQSVPSFARELSVSGPDGRYVLLDVQGGLKSKVLAIRAGYPFARSETFETRPGGVLSGVDVTLSNGYEVTGRLVNESGEPVSGAKVGATDREYGIEMMFMEFPGFVPQEFPLTDDEGKFVTHLGKGTWLLAFKAPGYVVTITEGKKIDSPADLGDLVIKPGGELSGRVVRESGTPVEDAVVALREPELGFTQATSDGDGHFVFRDLPRRTIVVTVYKPDGSRASKRIEVPATDVVFELPDVVTVRGRVVDGETKKPIADFMLGVTQSQPGVAVKEPYHSDDGTFEIEAVPSEGLAVAASAAGYVEAKKLIELAEGNEARPVELALTKGVRVYGTVTDSSGRPIDGVTVGYDKPVEMGRGGSMRMRDSQVTTDANGAFSFDSVEAGSAQFGFAKSGYLRLDRTIETTGRETRLDVELSTGVAVRGIVVDGSGAPVSKARVTGSVSGESRSYASTESGVDGRFVLEPIARGRGRITATAAGYAMTSVEDVEFGSGSEARLVMEEGAIVEGRVIGIDSSEMPNVVLSVGEGPSYERRVNSDGEFRIEDVRAGKAWVSASARLTTGYRRSKPIEAELVAGQVSRVEIEFEEGNTLRGVVTVGERTLGGASVLFRAKDGQSGGVHAIADDNGRYEATGLADGEYDVTVTEHYSRRWFETTYEMRGSGEYDIHFEDGQVDGRVVEAGTREPVDGATVTVEAGERSVSLMASSAVTDDDGRFVILASTTGELTVIARKKGYGPTVRQVRSADEASGLEIEMQKATGVRLRVTDARDGRALTPSVTIEDAAGRALTTENFQSAPDGVVTLDLAPGQYRILVWARGYAWRPVTVNVPSGEVSVALTVGGKLVLRTPIDQPRRVTVRDSEGNVVRRWPGDTRQTIVVAGATTLYALAAGEYSVESTPAAGGSTTLHKVTVVDGGTVELDVE